jgi:hypothetical protein
MEATTGSEDDAIEAAGEDANKYGLPRLFK